MAYSKLRKRGNQEDPIPDDVRLLSFLYVADVENAQRDTSKDPIKRYKLAIKINRTVKEYMSLIPEVVDVLLAKFLAISRLRLQYHGV